jgi:hypothetical protein
MTTLFQFQIVVTPVPDDDQVQQLLDLDDESMVERAPDEGIGMVWFTRTGPSLADAIVAATRDLEGVGLRPSQVKPREAVTVVEAAARLNRPAEEFRAWWEGTLSEPGAPEPWEMFSAGSGTVFGWDDIAAWTRTRLDVTVPDDPPILAAASAALRLRLCVRGVTGVEPLIAALVSPAQ